MAELGVNIDHVATIRNARGGRHPDPLRAARAAAEAGADGITAHLREDRRHIRDEDMVRLLAFRPLPFALAWRGLTVQVEPAVSFRSWLLAGLHREAPAPEREL